jgi:hypothetical protein
MNVRCRIGMHRWTFRTVSVEADGGRAEAVYASCRRRSCPTFSEARLVHWEGPIADERAARAQQFFLPADLLRR